MSKLLLVLILFLSGFLIFFLQSKSLIMETQTICNFSYYGNKLMFWTRQLSHMI